MSLTHIGPIPIEVLYNPDFRWTSGPDKHGVRDAVITGLVTWGEVRQLEELVGNQHRRITMAGRQGVLEFISADDALLAATKGWYLLQSVDVAGDQPSSVTGVVAFTLSCTFLGDRPVVVTHSARALESGAVASLADPFGSGSFLTDPSPVKVSREFDPRAEFSFTDPLSTETVDVFLEAL